MPPRTQPEADVKAIWRYVQFWGVLLFAAGALWALLASLSHTLGKQ